MKIGLTLEGGAMRGMYTAGVLDTFLEEGIRADMVAGASAGALFGANFLSGQKGRVIRYNKRFNRDPNYIGLRPLLREGNIVSTPYAYEKVPRELDPFDDETFRASGIPFYAVITDMDSGLAEYVRICSVFEQMDVLRASGSMPFVSRPVRIGEKQYLDGGIADPIPFRYLADQGCDRQIVVLTRDASYRKKPMSKAAVRAYGRYPRLQQRLLSRHQEYNDALELLQAWAREGRAFVIRPSEPIRIGRIEKDPQRLQQVYELGVKDAHDWLAELKNWMEK